MATYVIVHGGWGGGWEWSDVASHLTARGHEVWTPTLTGLGDRAHLAIGQRIGLTHHADDLVAFLTFADLEDVVLCGHSYGGAPVTLTADRVPERIRSIIYLDAIVPPEGCSIVDLVDPDFGRVVREGLAVHGEAWRMRIPSALLPDTGPEAARRRYVERLRDHPAASFVDAVQLTGAIDRLPRSYVRCVDTLGAEVPAEGDPTRPAILQALRAGWPFREIVAPHDVQLADPALAATVLAELV